MRRQLSFGAGIHHCPGADLAREEAATALARLFARYPGLRLTGPVTRLRSRVLRGLTSLPVDLGP